MDLAAAPSGSRQQVDIAQQLGSDEVAAMNNSDNIWDLPTDDALIERLIASLQRATVATIACAGTPNADVTLPAPEMATALLNLLASVLEPAPQCATPMGMRKLTEETGKRLLVLVRGYRDQQRSAGAGAAPSRLPT